MLISIVVKPNSKKSDVIKAEGYYKVYVKSPPKEGKANKETIELLAEYLNITKSRVVIKKGLKNKQKVVEVM